MNSTQTLAMPYKGLMPYSKEDAAFFFGREQERELIIANLMASRLTLLYGPSGVGKSSVINAGVVDRLQQLGRMRVAAHEPPESVVIVFRSWRDDPVEGLSNHVYEAVKQIFPSKEIEQSRSSWTLAECLRRWTELLDSELLIILDQFEEYFLYHPQEMAAGRFAVEVAQAITRADLRANFLISIREDAVARLDFFKGRIPNLFDNYLRIEHLNYVAAKTAIERPIEEFNRRQVDEKHYVHIEAELIVDVLDQVKIGQVLWSGSGQGAFERCGEDAKIETPYLQLVMTRLWDEEISSGSHKLRRETLRQLGGAASIIRTYLDNVMGALPVAEQDIAATLFRYLVTPSGSKIALTVSDLVSYTELSERQISPIRQSLSSHNVRILRPVNPLSGRETATRYEIFHDVLAISILDWQARHTQARELASARKSLIGLLIPFF